MRDFVKDLRAAGVSDGTIKNYIESERFDEVARSYSEGVYDLDIAQQRVRFRKSRNPTRLGCTSQGRQVWIKSFSEAGECDLEYANLSLVMVDKDTTHPCIVQCISKRDRTHLLFEVLAPVADTINMPEAARLFDDVIQALNHIHSRFLAHCDVKPDNILRTPSGLLHFKLIDMCAVTEFGRVAHQYTVAYSLGIRIADRALDYIGLILTIIKLFRGRICHTYRRMLEQIECLPPELNSRCVGILPTEDAVAALRHRTADGTE